MKMKPCIFSSFQNNFIRQRLPRFKEYRKLRFTSLTKPLESENAGTYLSPYDASPSVLRLWTQHKIVRILQDRYLHAGYINL